MSGERFHSGPAPQKSPNGIGQPLVERDRAGRAPLNSTLHSSEGVPATPSSPQKSHWAETYSTKRGSIRYDLARRPNWFGRARFTRTACGIYSPGSSGQARGGRCLPGRLVTPGPSLRAEVPRVGAHHRHPRRSRIGRTLTPQSGDPFAMTWRVAPTGLVGRASRGLLAASTALVPRVKPEDDDVSRG